jgi:hypothetical protein
LIGNSRANEYINEIIWKNFNSITIDIDEKIRNIIYSTPSQFLQHLFGVFRNISLNTKLIGWMETMIKLYVWQFAHHTKLAVSIFRTRPMIDAIHQKAIKEYSPMLPVGLQPSFERLVNISRGQFWLIEPERGSKFKVSK